MTKTRLKTYFKEAKKHIDLIEESLDVLKPKILINIYDRLESRFNEIEQKRSRDY